MYRSASIVPRMLLSLFLLTAGQVLLAQSDTLNQVLPTGEKTGYWQLRNEEGQLVEEGRYENDRKEGLWKSYYPEGGLQHEITYQQGIANGPARFFFEDGRLWEEGNWKEAYWVGAYKLYHASGKPAYEFTYNQYGKRQGEQRYYYPDGTLKYKGKWARGQIDGHVEVYDSTGTLQQIRSYSEGSFESTTDLQLTRPEAGEANGERVLSPFHGTGQHTTRKMDGRLYQKGYFRDGVLQDGEEYIYDDQRQLRQVRIYENGKLIRIRSGSDLPKEQPAQP